MQELLEITEPGWSFFLSAYGRLLLTALGRMNWSRKKQVTGGQLKCCGLTVGLRGMSVDNED